MKRRKINKLKTKMVIVCVLRLIFFLCVVVTFFFASPVHINCCFLPSSLHYFYYIYSVYPYVLLHHHHSCCRCRCRRRRVMRPNVLSLLSMCMVCLVWCCCYSNNLFDTVFAFTFLTTNRQSLLYGCVFFFFGFYSI